MPPRSSWLLLWILLTGFTGFMRFGLRDFLFNLRSFPVQKQLRVAIYGAGQPGAQLASSLRSDGKYKIIAFFDDNPNFWKRSIGDVPILPPQIATKLHETIDQLLIAVPSLPRLHRRRIVEDFQKIDVSVLQMPSVDDLAIGRATVSSLRPVAIEDLLGRDPVQHEIHSYYCGIEGKVVCLTGAGGSIGSELCRQVLTLRPSAASQQVMLL